MNKKALTGSMAVLLVLAGCSAGTASTTETEETASAETVTTKAQTITTSANGKNGAVTVETSFDENGVITAVNVTDHSETTGIYECVFDTLPDAIVENQSVNLDVVSGATFTSRAILNAVSSAIEEAGYDTADYQNEIEQTSQEVTIDTDVVVVGAGGAGLSAAVEAANAGANVVVIESNAWVGGGTALSGGMVLTAADEEEVEEYNSLDAEALTAALKEWGSEYFQEEITYDYLSHTKENLQWVIDQYSGDDVIMTHNPGWVPLTHDTEEINHTLAIAMTEEEDETWADGLGFWVTDSLKNSADELGVEFYLSTTATELLSDDGVATGILAESVDGTTYTINAKSVVIASGGYGANAELKKLYTETDGIYYGPTSNTGFGVFAGESIGAKLEFAILSDTGGEYGAAVYSTIGGLVINDSAEVLDEDDNPIENLYAAGEITCVIALDPAHFSSGENVGWGIYTGRKAGVSAAENALSE